MDTVGEYLRNIRLSKGISIDEVARLTNISRRYIEGIENNDFSEFPGEAYIRGFIKSYALFLEADVELAISLYEKSLIEEKEIPINALLGKGEKTLPSWLFPKLIVITLGAIGIVAISIWAIYALLGNSEKIVSQDETKVVYIASLSENQVFQKSAGGKNIYLKLLELKDKGTIAVISVNNKTYEIGVSQSALADFDLDGQMDVKVKFASLNEMRNKSTLEITIFKEIKYKTEKEESITVHGGTIPLDMTIAVQNTVWVEVTIDDSQPIAFYLNKGDLKAFKIKSKVIIKSSSGKAVKLYLGNVEVSLGDTHDVSYVELNLRPTMSGVYVQKRILQ